ncbi:SUKH-3 domain-containing protein [Myceligenerans xiligouense]|uniref:SUKH-3 immunity protein of toxin-antitoxin system n=1 Tax=Myceligenerans xiligouense TaxID=253184 RepID=A0A3N4YKT3_9MICO|nr:SUKH-3 domain-containing protein [Myceligenerans xiligouense]RPF21709.1 SUKH-3 immunity protein of toxin-antitoxin system [Myceligenerans xiligouense]
MISNETMRTLRRAGWTEGRVVDTIKWRLALENDGFSINAAAEAFLAEFGGLAVPEGGPGVARFRGALVFDPLLCIGEEDRFAEWGRLVVEPLSPIGELEDGRFLLGMDAKGTVYAVSSRLGRFDGAETAIDALVLGGAIEWLV